MVKSINELQFVMLKYLVSNLIQNIQIIPLCTWSNLMFFSKYLLEQKLENFKHDQCIEISILQLNYAAASGGH